MPQQKSEPVAFTRGEREAAGRREVGAIVRQFDDHACDRAAFQRLFHRKQRVDGASSAQHQKTLRRQAEQVETWTINRAAFEPRIIGLDPQRLAAAAGGQRGERQREPRGRAEIDRPLRRGLVQRAEVEAAAQHRIGRSPDSQRGLGLIELKMLDILYRLAETAEPIRSDRTGQKTAHWLVPVLFLLIPGIASSVKQGSGKQGSEGQDSSSLRSRGFGRGIDQFAQRRFQFVFEALGLVTDLALARDIAWRDPAHQ
jgi:hypothetical protein